MKINKIQILNLLSYEESELLPEQYNVIVGPNGSGKTNIIRILRFLAGRDAVGTIMNDQPLNYLELPRAVKTDPEKQSAIKIDFTLSEHEAWMLLQFILRDDRILAFEREEMRRISLVIRWPNSRADQMNPDLLFFHFSNGLIMMNQTTFAHLASQNSTLSVLLASLDAIPLADSDIHNSFHNHNRYALGQVIENQGFKRAFVAGDIMNAFFFENNKWFRIGVDTNQVTVGYNVSFPAKYQNDIFDYCNAHKEQGRNLTMWNFARALLRNSIVFMSEVRPQYQDLAYRLLGYKNSSEQEFIYDSIKKRFSELFGGVKVDAFEKDVFDGRTNTQSKEYFIQVTENSKKFRLENAAAGYFGALYIFTEIATGDHGVIILDEPALHLHPLKVKKLGRILTKLAGNQVILVTHSPYFVNVDLFKEGTLFKIRAISHPRSIRAMTGGRVFS